MAERVYSYRNLASLNNSLMWLQLVVFPIVPIYFLTKGGGPPLAMVIPLAAMCLLGLVFTVRYGLIWANEKIVISDQEVAWIGPLGKDRVRCPLKGIEKGSLTSSDAVAVSVGGSGSRRLQKKWQFSTQNGVIRFGSGISSCPDLLSDLERVGAAEPAGQSNADGRQLVCRYGDGAMILGVVVCFGLFCACVVAVVAMATGKAKMADSGEPVPFVFPLVFGAAGLALGFLAGWMLLVMVNERISINGDEIVWRDNLGRVRVHCSPHDVLPGGLKTKIRSSGNGSTTTYRVQTSQGEIKFSNIISNSEALVARLDAMGRSSGATKGFS